MKFIKNIFSSKSAYLFFLLHWLLFYFGLFQRGDSIGLFEHFYYEPILLKILMLIDIPGLILAGIVERILFVLIETVPIYLLGFLFISLQWILIGYVIGRIFQHSTKVRKSAQNLR